MKFFSIIVMVTIIGLITAGCNNNTATDGIKVNSNNVFGDSIPVSNGLVGKIFLLPENTTKLPDFDTMTPQHNKIYTTRVDIPEQGWIAGFPGFRSRFEWFGIEYTCFFKTDKPGNYVFRLLSDDGSKLFIDDKMIIDNDGIHGASSESGNIFLNDSMHMAKILYFQGPRNELALQLFWSLENSKEQIFPGNNFILYTPKDSSHFMWWLLLAAVILIAVIFFLWRKRKSVPS